MCRSTPVEDRWYKSSPYLILHCPVIVRVPTSKLSFEIDFKIQKDYSVEHGLYDVRFEVFTEVIKKNGYQNPDRISQETHHVSATELSRLMLFKIWGYHGGDYEKCRVMGYENPVRTSQETLLLRCSAQPVNAM
jgi:hypothetical protein